MGFSQMGFSPEDGLRDDSYDTTPVSEEAAREQIQGRLDELKDYINDVLRTELASVTTNQSGADNIGSAAIDEVNGSTVWAQLFDLKGKIDDLLNFNVPDNSIDSDKIIAGAIVEGKLGTEAVDTINIKAGAVTTEKLGVISIGAGSIANGAVISEKIGLLAVEKGQIALNAVTEGNIEAEAVTHTKILQGEVWAYHLASGAVTEDKINASAKSDSVASASSTILATSAAAKTAYERGSLGVTNAAAAQSTANSKQKAITISTSAPSGGSDGDIWLEVI